MAERATFFFYGTLMDPAVLSRVSGMAVTAARLRPATLEGYRCLRVAGRHYPAITPSDGYRVEGKLFRGVSDEARRRIEIYEDDSYIQRIETVVGQGGLRAKATMFIAGPAMRLSEDDWDFATWCRQHRHPFLRQLEGWISRYGRAEASEIGRIDDGQTEERG